MAASLQWTEPLTVRQQQWQTKDIPEIKTFLRLFGKWLLLLGVPSLVAIYYFMPTELPHVVGIAHDWILRK